MLKARFFLNASKFVHRAFFFQIGELSVLICSSSSFFLFILMKEDGDCGVFLSLYLMKCSFRLSMCYFIP